MHHLLSVISRRGKMRFAVLVLMQILVVVKVYGDCNRPEEIVKYEEECFQEHAGFIEKVSQKATSFFESAKKRLGITTEITADDQKPKKCDYYQCILMKMHVTDPHNLPDFNTFKNKYEAAYEDVDEIKECFAMAANIEQMLNSQESTVDAIEHDGRKTIKQARDTMNEILCEVNLHVVRCLSKITHKDNKCPLFAFP